VLMSHATLGAAGHTTPPTDDHPGRPHDDRRPPSPGGNPEGPEGGSPAGDVTAHGLSPLEQEVEDLRRRLLTQPVIEQAKGLLIGLYGVDADTAFAVLVRWSQHSNTKLHLLAAELVAVASKPGGQPHAAMQRFIHSLPQGRNSPAR
jgi:hypothetical protein